MEPAEPMDAINWDLDKQYLFQLEYFVHDFAYVHPISAVKQPALAIRFMDFPTQLLNSRSKSKLLFRCGRRSKFTMNPAYLRKGLFDSPFYVMFIDAVKSRYNPATTPVFNSVQILASSAVNISCLCKNNDFLNLGEKKTIRRNVVTLFDKVRNEVGKVDLTLCLSRVSPLPVEVHKVAATAQEETQSAPQAGKRSEGATQTVMIIEKAAPQPERLAAAESITKVEAAVATEEFGKENAAGGNRETDHQARSAKKGKEKRMSPGSAEKKRAAAGSIADLAQQCYCPPAMFFQKN